MVLGSSALVSLVAAGTVAIACWCPAAVARDAVVRSFDGTPIVAHFFAATELASAQRAPTVLVGSPFGVPGQTDRTLDGGDRIGIATLLRHGYNVLTWDPRGFGGSGGTSHFDSVDFEARDVRALIDFVAAQPEALLDQPGDPRVGMSGTSYGATIQLVTAAIEPRLDAVVPDLAWHSLGTSLFNEGSVKTGWLTPICVNGEVLGLLGGVAGPAGVQLGSVDGHFLGACAQSATLGTVSPADVQWFVERGPAALMNRVRVPTLLMQGTFDTLFTLGEAIANYDALRRSGVPVKMLWYCGGHGFCATDSGKPGHLTATGLRWLARWLKRDTAVDTGARFEWLADDGVWRSGVDYPLAPKGAMSAIGSGSMLITPTVNLALGAVTVGTPPIAKLQVSFPPPPRDADIVGKPSLRLTYRGTASPANTWLYVKVIDTWTGHAVGDQVVPIPVVLDGRARTLERRLPAIALRGGPATELRLQISSATPLYAPQRSLGKVSLERIEGSLPLVDAARSGREQGIRPTPAAAAGRRPRASAQARRRAARARARRAAGRARAAPRRSPGRPRPAPRPRAAARP